MKTEPKLMGHSETVVRQTLFILYFKKRKISNQQPNITI